MILLVYQNLFSRVGFKDARAFRVKTDKYESSEKYSYCTAHRKWGSLSLLSLIPVSPRPKLLKRLKTFDSHSVGALRKQKGFYGSRNSRS